jgi:hypothetical protein
MPVLSRCLQYSANDVAFSEYMIRFGTDILKTILGTSLFFLSTKFIKPIDTFWYALLIIFFLLIWIGYAFATDIWAILFVSCLVCVYFDMHNLLLPSSLLSCLNIILIIMALSAELDMLSRAIPEFK